MEIKNFLKKVFKTAGIVVVLFIIFVIVSWLFGIQS